MEWARGRRSRAKKGKTPAEARDLPSSEERKMEQIRSFGEIREMPYHDARKCRMGTLSLWPSYHSLATISVLSLIGSLVITGI